MLNLTVLNEIRREIRKSKENLEKSIKKCGDDPEAARRISQLSLLEMNFLSLARDQLEKEINLASSSPEDKTSLDEYTDLLTENIFSGNKQWVYSSEECSAIFPIDFIPYT